MQKRFLGLLLTLTMLVLSSPNSAMAATGYHDTKGHWAEAVIEKWSDYNIVQGYDGNFSPDATMTRAEMATIFTRMMNYSYTSSANFSDLSKSHWGYDALLKANYAGVFQGDGGAATIRPDELITWQEAMVTLCRALGITPSQATSADPRLSTTSSWAQGYVRALFERGLITAEGGDYKYDAKAPITRAQVLQFLDHAVKGLYTKGGMYTGTLNGTVIVSAEKTTLKDMTISGDLIIAEGVGEGEVILENTVVNGNIIVRGGGANSIIIRNSSVVSLINVEKNINEPPVAVKFEDNTKATGISAIEGNLHIYGKVSNVDIIGTDTDVKFYGADVKTVTVSAPVAVEFGKDSAVSTVITNSAAVLNVATSANIAIVKAQGAGTKIEGLGKVGVVQANANQVAVTIPNTKVEVAAKVTGVTAGGKAVSAGANVTVNNKGDNIVTTPSGSHSGSSSTGGGTSDNATALGEQTIVITAPETDATSQSTIAAGSGFTGTITWIGEMATDGKFKAHVDYRATIVLTSASGYKWPSTPPTITLSDGTLVSSVVSGTNSGNTLTISVSFPTTLPYVKGIAIYSGANFSTAFVTMSDNTPLDKTDLVVSFSNDGSTFENVNFNLDPYQNNLWVISFPANSKNGTIVRVAGLGGPDGTLSQRPAYQIFWAKRNLSVQVQDTDNKTTSLIIKVSPPTSQAVTLTADNITLTGMGRATKGTLTLIETDSNNDTYELVLTEVQPGNVSVAISPLTFEASLFDYTMQCNVQFGSVPINLH